jgi:hypothetical protein
MPVGEFYFLLAGMRDLTHPDTTDPMSEVIKRRLEALTAAHSAKRRR